MMRTDHTILSRLAAAVSSAVLVLTLMETFLPMAKATESAERQTIRMAFPTQESMSYFGHSSKVTGYNYDYLEKISEYTGWEMDYIA